mmetsp:Transcript_17077/g.40751  ORF Transcript_17077/g.40751 Transcript_17077/m.40751 type:complete len:541 (-) Transcript_17077:190-1812(-)
MSFIIQMLRERYASLFPKKVAVTAATGIAATHIAGTTLHSFAGCGIPQTSNDFDRMWKKEPKERWRSVEVLIIDEISMVSAEFFAELEKQARCIRGDPRPWGGIQVILCGDFFQLPPIEKRFSPKYPPETFYNRGFTFQCPVWRQGHMRSFLLSKVFRQKDPEFVSILNDIRRGSGSSAIPALLSKCQRPIREANGVKATQLFSRNVDVDKVNSSELAALNANEVYFHANDSVEVLASEESDPARHDSMRAQLQRNEFFRDCLAPQELCLKVGAQVMLLKNLELDGATGRGMLVNGSRGVVASMVPKSKYLKELEALQQLDPKTYSQELAAVRAFSGDVLPQVAFSNGRREVLGPEKFSCDVLNLGTCNRHQIPLKLAWALTIHKCQGMTLDLAKVSLRNVFAEGQAYVALSRVRSLDGLQILDGHPDCVKVNPTVRKFYESLERGEEYCDDAWERWQQEKAGPAPAKRGPFPARHQPGPPGHPRSGTCFRCGQPGHWASSCPGRKAVGGATRGNSAPTARGRGAAQGSSSALARLMPHR